MTTALDLLLNKREQLQTELAQIEKKVYDTETHYLAAEYSQCGTVLKGLEGFLSSKDTLRKRARAFKVEDRLFSLSSRSSPATIELEQSALESAMDGMVVPGRGKGTYASKGIANKQQASKGRR